MANSFKRMSLSDTRIFLIRKLDTHGMKTDMPSGLVRSEIHCFFFVSKGESLITIGEETYLIKENECAIIPAGQVFSVRYYNDCKGFMGGFHTDFLNAGTDGKNILQTFAFLRKWGGHKVTFDEQHALYVANVFERLYEEKQKNENKDILKAYLIALLVEIDGVYENTSNKDLNINNELCNSFIEYVFENPDLSKPIAFHANRLNITPGHLQKILKRFTGKTPLTWINDAVVLEAKSLLSHTDLPIASIAEKVGIQDPSYFARLFKRQTGLSPAAFRNTLKNT